MNENTFGSLQDNDERAAYLRSIGDGVKHLWRVEPRQPTAEDAPLLTVTVGLDQQIGWVECMMVEPEEQMIPFKRVKTEWDLLNWRYYDIWQATLPPQPDNTLVRYRIAAYPEDGGKAIMADGGETFSYIVGKMSPPDWAPEAVIYQVFPDRFHPGKGRQWNKTKSRQEIHGGTIRGIIDNLDHISGLGCNCIWLNPFFPDDTHHGYHATDYFSVNPRMGTLEDIQELVVSCHSAGIRLLLDFVANHWGRKHPYFQAALADKDSQYYDWFYWKKWPDEYETFYDVMELPKINVDHPPARQHLFDCVRFWLGEIGFDGLRMDHANGPSLDFWTELRQVAAEVMPGAWLFGEVVRPPANLLNYAGRLHGCLDFALTQAIRDTFAFGSMDAAAFDAFLTKHERFFPSNFSRPSFLDNHDGDRFLFVAGGDKRKLKLAALCLFTLKHAPIVYYGTEAGLSQESGKSTGKSQGWEENRQPMAWGDEQDEELSEYFRWLVDFRKGHPVIWQGERKTVHVDGDAGTYAYAIVDADETLLVSLNLSDREQVIAVNDPTLFIEHTTKLSPWHGDVHAVAPRKT